MLSYSVDGLFRYNLAKYEMFDENFTRSLVKCIISEEKLTYAICGMKHLFMFCKCVYYELVRVKTEQSTDCEI